MLTRRAKGARKSGPEEWIISGKDPPGTEIRMVSGDVGELKVVLYVYVTYCYFYDLKYSMQIIILVGMIMSSANCAITNYNCGSLTLFLSGLGVFALKEFHKGEFILEYPGELKISASVLDNQDQTYIYFFRHKGKDLWYVYFRSYLF